MERNPVVMPMIVVEVAAKLLQVYHSREAFRESNHSERMGCAIIKSVAVLANSSLFNIPRRRNYPSVMLVGARHGDHSKRKLVTQIIHCLVVPE
jgi:hypothetical protein